MSHYQDLFAQQNLPKEHLPSFLLDNPQFQHPEELNCAYRLLDHHIDKGDGNRICIRSEYGNWTYKQLQEKSNQIAHVLTKDLGLKSGNRVLLRSANNPMLVACWFGVIKAGGIVVTTMPLLRSKELNTIIEYAEISHVLCDKRLHEEIDACNGTFVKHKAFFDGTLREKFSLEMAMEKHATTFSNFNSLQDDVALIGFTSGTTGKPKMTAHYHRDILNICEAFPPFALQPHADDIFTGSPPLGFTFGLGGLVLFPMYFGASSYLIEKPSPDILLSAVEKEKITICFTAPTAWRIIQTKVGEYDISSLRKCVSAGESLPKKVWHDWHNATGLKIIDGIGATEMLHIFISANGEHMKPGATGVAVPGYEAKLVDDNGNEVPPNTEGKLAVKGITGCRYLNRPEKQREYVKNGWNLTGDIFTRDEDGYFWYVSRSDDMIISSGYNISAVVVEATLLGHPDILECGVIGIPDEERGMLVCAHIVLKNQALGSDEKAKEIQDWFKQNAAPYKYPRKIVFTSCLPKTQTGKIQRYKLKQEAPKSEANGI
ncbi:AMP-binding protein [Luteibaculum oceani]|uniref:AMP-binding protein n=1 Tax=Luteibaculum oceani TaxID=1294296 RepID=A0A5C6VA59_9FLAO|nr:AMP-binding protein [Luteibaculum oceani]TXC82099.1 AMP-binding protein [Luteibaculum oceani]